MEGRFCSSVDDRAELALPWCSSGKALHAFPKCLRLRRRREFIRLRHTGSVFATETISIQWGHSPAPHARVGVTVTTKQGSAVERNLFRRRVKEAFRQSSLKWHSAIDMNVRPRGGKLSVPYEDIQKSLAQFNGYLSTKLR